MAQVNKISSFKSFTEVKNQEATMKLRETNNVKRQETVGKIGAILDEMGLTSLSELDEVKKQALINKMFGNVSEDEAEDIEDELNKLGEPKKLKEGNAFGAAVKKAKDAGEKEFEFEGETYKVEEALNILNEARSISKIQYDWSKVTTQMQATAQNWKAAEGSAKEMLLGKLKEMTSQKKALEAELDAAIADKDKDLELVVTEAFNRLPKDVIGTELYTANQNLQSFYSRVSAGNDVDPKDLDAIIKLLQQVKSLTKKFNNKEEVLRTVYEGEVNEAEKFKSTKDFLEFCEEIDGMPENRIKRIMGKDYIDTPGGFRDEADDYDNDIEEYMISNMGKSDFNELKTWWENNVAESLVNEAEIKSDDEFKEYAMTVLKKAFGDDFDEAKAGEVVDGILKKCDGDYGACVGMLTSSLGESVVTDTDNDKLDTKDIDYSDEDDDDDEDDDEEDEEDDDNELDEAFDANYWEDYHEDAPIIKNPSGMQLQQEVQAAVEEWNDNNENGEKNEVTPAGEKKVLKLAKEYVKAKGYICHDVIDAMISQES